MTTKGFGVEFIAPQEFSSKEWWLPLRQGPRWFYHTPRDGEHQAARDVLTDTVDPELIPLVTAARVCGLDTEASCAGHSVSPGYTKRLYAALVRDMHQVRGNGLHVLNVETREGVCWRDPDYTLPWADWHVLDGHLQTHSQVGMITLSGPAAKLSAVRRALRAEPRAFVEQWSGKLRLWVMEDTAEDRARVWSNLAKAVLHGCH
jgi:hypothetical protein